MSKRLLAIALLNFVNVLGFAVMIPVFPFIVEQYGGNAILYGILLAAYPLFQFLGAPALGTLSDHFGRRPILMLSQAGTLLSWIIFGIAYFLPSVSIVLLPLPIIVIMLSRITDGITGGNFSVANAYVSDITPPSEKTKVFGILGSIVGVGLIIGPVVGGYSASLGVGYLGPVLFSFVLSLVTLLFMYFYLPETLEKKDRRSILKFHILREVNVFGKIGQLKNKFLKKLFFMRSFFAFAFSCYTSTIVLLMIDRFHLAADKIGLLFLVLGTFFIFNQAVATKFIADKFGNLGAYYFGQFVFALGLVLLVFAPNIPVFLFVAYLVNLGFSTSFPTFRSLITDHVDRARQGTVTGIDESVLAGSSAVAPVLMGFLYQYIGQWAYGLLAVWLFLPHIILYVRSGRVFLKEPVREIENV